MKIRSKAIYKSSKQPIHNKDGIYPLTNIPNADYFLIFVYIFCHFGEKWKLNDMENDRRKNNKEERNQE